MSATEALELQGDIAEVIKKVRRMCKISRKIPKKNDVLINEEDEVPFLKLDCRTKRNSPGVMLSRLVHLKNPNSYPQISY